MPFWTSLQQCPNCRREFNGSVEGEYCPECWNAWMMNNGRFERREVPLTEYLNREIRRDQPDLTPTTEG